MAKKMILVGLIVFLFAVAFAAPGYCDDPLKKLGRGLCNLATFPFELCLQTSRVNQTDGPMAGATWGVLKGIGMGVARLMTGAYETITFPFPLPADYVPILKDPEFMFEDQNW